MLTGMVCSARVATDLSRSRGGGIPQDLCCHPTAALLLELLEYRGNESVMDIHVVQKY